MRSNPFRQTPSDAHASRPDFAGPRGPGEESVWDYPRPPAVRRDGRLIEVRSENVVIAKTTASFKVMETASPPTFYISPEHVDLDALVRLAGATICEWKGAASYWALAADLDRPVAWSYERPRARFDMIRGFLAFYPGRVECFVDGERVRPQPGRFYGGWITGEVVGPFKGEPGTGHW
ncbi:MAG: DUF427 domain-containing protein [Woeseiaceae bacterium]|nr:DUF427 domain-containing protein [Woeseiaceae bacterium]